MYGKRVTKAVLLTLDEAMNSIITCWMEIQPADGEAYLEPVNLCFGRIVNMRGMRLSLERFPALYNRRPGIRIWAGPVPTDQERAAEPWET